MPNQKYSSKYFFECLKKLRRIISASKNYRTLEDLMSAKSNAIEPNHLNTSQGMEK